MTWLIAGAAFVLGMLYGFWGGLQVNKATIRASYRESKPLDVGDGYVYVVHRQPRQEEAK
jgi:hypothetical protein